MHARTLALALASVLILITVAAAAPLENPATPPGGVQTITPVESWRAGGEDDEVFFGSVGRVLAGPDGQIMVLDTQRAQVQVYDHHGQWLRTLGREGDGPGEVRGPADAFLVPDGRLCIPQGFPGRLVYLNADGTPGGQAQYTPLGEPSSFYVIVSAMSAPEGMLLAGIRFAQNGPTAVQTYFLSLCNADGAEQAVYHEKEVVVNYADLRLDEGKGDFVWVTRTAVDPTGRVYTAPERNRYLVQVQNPDGTLSHEFTRPVTIPERTADEHKIAVKIQEAIGANYGGVPVQGVSVEKTDAAIAGLWVRPDGEVWVATPANEPPEGAFTMLDAYDAEGHFLRQVVLDLPGDRNRDGLYLLSDGRMVQVLGGLDAWLSQQGVESSSDNAPVLEVVVYEAI